MKKILSFALALVLVTSMTSCDDDDDKGKSPGLQDVVGVFAGEMTFKMDEVVAPTLLEVPASDSLEFNVKEEKGDYAINFDKFPIKSLLVSIVGEAAAEGLLPQIGDVKYSTKISKDFKVEKDSVRMILNPEPLMITLKNPEKPAETLLSVKVVITSPQPAVYALKTKDIGFQLIATDIFLGDATTPLPLENIVLTFDASKKK